ncbi:O-antigen ligase family protein [Clostridium butyricum]|uniref:O-antigen ligase family protein n=1 Tax=Clostridium butyricum TaxID=1492 RepID=UPI0011BD8C7D|nr:O-antigen ligase family protein [Clostridium butyricum]
MFFYIFGSVLKVVSANSDILLRWGTDRYVSSYHNLYYETQTINIFGKQIIRNTGIFTEAPMYAFNLCISLSVEVFIRKKQKNKKIIVLLFTILTTFSTTGIVVSLLIISINLINSRKNYGLLKKMCLYLFVMILMISSMFFINYKVIQSKDIYGSYSIRMDDIKVGIEAWKDNIIMGKGYNRYDLVQQYMSINDRGNDIGGSNGIMKILPEGGIYLLSIYIFPLVIALVYSIKYRVKNVIIFETILVILLININVPYRFIMIYFLSLGLSYLFKNDSSKIGENYEKI